MSDENIINQTQRDDGGGNFLDILGKLMANQAQKEDVQAPAEKPSSEPNILSSLLQNPDLIAKLPELLSIITPLMGSLSNQSGSANPLGLLMQTGAKPSEPASHSPQNRELQNRSALLCALKPYLKKERQDAIDYMIKLSRLGDILKTL